MGPRKRCDRHLIGGGGHVVWCRYALPEVWATAALISTKAVSKISTCTSFGPAPAALAASARGPASLLSLASRSSFVSHTVDAASRPVWRSTLAIVAR